MPDPIHPARIIPAGQPWPPLQRPSVAPGPPSVPPAPPASPPVPPGGGGVPPWLPPQAPAPWNQPPQRIDLHLTVHPPVPVEPDLTWWQRLARAVPYRVSPLVAVTAIAAASIPLPGVGYGVGRIWGSLLDHLGTGVHPAASHAAAAVALAVVAARIHRPCHLRTNLVGGLVRRLTWLDAFGVAVTVIGGTWGVLWPDLVAATTGVRA
ncbi:hypothetical protein AB0F64_37520 [Streptomyces sp. NPDC026294]|uniref:hypothetical protein n=1 Tax=Streptomyces sp. NPDC026294 TaxID=3155362 RepID=UPI0034012C95